MGLPCVSANFLFSLTGSRQKNESPRYWIASKKAVGLACVKHPAHGSENWERRFRPDKLNKEWKDNWGIFAKYML